jgi:hypothetical protein
MRSALLGGQTQAERDKRGAGHGVGRAADRALPDS